MLTPYASGQSGKRGIGGGEVAQANALNAEWYYNWGNNPSAEILGGGLNGQFVPMIWSANASTIQTTVDRILGYKETLGIDYVMGFNEPERAEQANMSVSDAIAIWDTFDHQFAAANIKLSSPQVGTDTGGRAWLDDFMTQATALNLKVDSIGVHWYGTVSLTNPAGSGNSFLNLIDSLHTQYGKPIWISEFAGMDWGADDITSPALIAANEAFLNVVIPGLESRSHVERYSWWQYGRRTFSPEEDPTGTRFEAADTRLIEQVGDLWTPTGIGDQYIPSYREGEQFNLNGTDPGELNFYLRGGTLTNTTGSSVTVASVDAIDGNSDLGGSVDWRVENGVFRVRSGATLRKIGANRVTISGPTVSNSGELEVVSGTLAFEKGAQVGGAGSIDIAAAATLALGAAIDRAGVSVSQPIELTGGVIQSVRTIDGVHALNAPITVLSTSTLTGDGTLLVNGPLQSPAAGPAGGIVKEGSGSVILSANSPFRGGVTVRAGTLALGANASLAAATGFAVESGGRFDVSDVAGGIPLASGQTLTNMAGGTVDGHVVVGSGAEVSAAGVFKGNLSTQAGGTIAIGGDGSTTSLPTTIRITPPLGVAGNNSDVRIRSGSNASSNQNDTQALGIGSINATDAFRSLLTFDLSATGITDPSHIDSVALTLTLAPPNGAQVNTPAPPTLELHTTGAYNSDTVNFNNAPSMNNLIATTTGPNFAQFADGDQIEWSQATSGGFVDAVRGALGGSLRLGAKVETTFSTRSFYFVNSAESSNANAVPSLEITYTDPTVTGIASAVVEGDLTMAAGSGLEVDLLNTTMFDQIDVNGNATLDGVLSVKLLDPSQLSVNDTFTILTADSIVNNLTLGGPNGAFFNLSASTPTSLVLTYVGAISLPGDFNGDAVVDAADYTVWRDNLGSPEGTLLSSNGTGGTVDTSDYNLWKANYGVVTASTAQSSAVPEPGVVVLALLSLISPCCVRRCS